MERDMEELAKRIRSLARQKNAVILAHNYQRPEIQDIADLTGDSLELSIKASRTDADMIVFCGVHFMAETAAILCPSKKVVLPVATAGCAMAEMITAEDLLRKKAGYPGVPVVTYVNSGADVKAESDICCTSANAIQVVRSLDASEVIMTPDRNLANWVQRHTDQKIHAWPGFCPIHDALTVAAVNEARTAHPRAVLMAHPECRLNVLEMADVVRSTSGMLDYAAASDAREFIVATENGLLHALAKHNPEKAFYPASPLMVCADMKKTGLFELLRAIEDEGPVITVPEDVRVRAFQAVERMLAVPRD